MRLQLRLQVVYGVGVLCEDQHFLVGMPYCQQFDEGVELLIVVCIPVTACVYYVKECGCIRTQIFGKALMKKIGTHPFKAALVMGCVFSICLGWPPFALVPGTPAHLSDQT